MICVCVCVCNILLCVPLEILCKLLTGDESLFAGTQHKFIKQNFVIMILPKAVHFNCEIFYLLLPVKGPFFFLIESILRVHVFCRSFQVWCCCCLSGQRHFVPHSHPAERTWKFNRSRKHKISVHVSALQHCRTCSGQDFVSIYEALSNKLQGLLYVWLKLEMIKKMRLVVLEAFL